MTQRPNQHSTDANLIRSAGGNLVRGFIAYPALTPAIFCWGLLLIILSIVTLASFQEQTNNLLTAVFNILRDLKTYFPFVDRFSLEVPLVNDAGVIEIHNNNLGDVIFSLYGYLTLPFVILSMVLDMVRGVRPPRPLPRKIKILGFATLAVIVLFFANFLFGSEIWSGSVLFWSLMFTIGPGLVYLVSVVSSSLHHFIASEGFGTPGKNKPG